MEDTPTITVDMELFTHQNDVAGNLVAALYAAYGRKIPLLKDNHYEKRREIEATFKDCIQGVSRKKSEYPYGHPWAGENAFDILRDMAKSSDMAALIGNLTLQFEELFGKHQVLFDNCPDGFRHDHVTKQSSWDFNVTYSAMARS